jgi:delta24-sterol reductase
MVDFGAYEYQTWHAIVLVATLALVFRKWIGYKIIDLVTTEYRWVIIVPVVLPMSLIFNCCLHVRNRYVEWTRSAPHKHDERVAKLQKEIRGRDKSQPMCTARPNWQTTSIFHAKYKSTFFKADLSGFRDVLKIDKEKMTVKVEPLVSVSQLTSHLAPLGLTTAVMPELDDLTVGGLIAGFGVETSSWEYGLFQHICVSYDVILANGDLVKCSATENAELFYTIPWSYGTVGFLVAAELKLVKAKPYVRVKYEPAFTRKQYVDLLDKRTREGGVDFIECLVYSSDTAVVMTGTMVDKPDYKEGALNPIGRFWKPWFFEHVRGFLKTKEAVTEFIPLRDYYHRHTKSLFWEMGEILPFGNHPFFRYTLGWLIPPKVSFLKLTTTETLHKVYEQKHVDQDMLVPMRDLDKCLTAFHKEWELYPLWLCPCRIPKTPIRGLVNPVDGVEDDMFIDVGAYGVPHRVHAKDYEPQSALRRVEQFVRDVKGFQALYALTLMTRTEFEEMFDHKVYSQLRKKYECDGAFPVIYDKISRAART